MLNNCFIQNYLLNTLLPRAGNTIHDESQNNKGAKNSHPFNLGVYLIKIPPIIPCYLFTRKTFTYTHNSSRINCIVINATRLF